MNKDQKMKEVEKLSQTLGKAKVLFFAENKGLTVADMTDLRKRLRKEHAAIKVVKNRLMKLALDVAKVDGIKDYFVGPTALTYSETDPVSPAKVLVEFIKDRENFIIKGGYLDGQVLTAEKVKALAQLPSREELYSMLLRVMVGPARQLATVLAAVPRQVVTVVDAIRKQKESQQ